MAGYEHLKLDCKFPVNSILGFRVAQKPNAHGSMRLRAIIPQETGHAPTIAVSLGSEIRLYTEEDGETNTLFHGHVSNVISHGNDGVYTLDLEAVSATALLDLQKKKRSFQSQQMAYEDLLDIVTDMYGENAITSTVNVQNMIPAPVVQYEETDWEFLKRMASNFHTVLYADIKHGKPKLWFGFPNARSESPAPDIHNYLVEVDLKRQMIATGSNIAVDDGDYLSYVVELMEAYDLGDEISFKGRRLYVAEKEAYLKNGLVCYTYRFAQKKYVLAPRLYNENATGLQLEGTVLSTAGETVKVHLHIDEEQNEATAYPFPYAPPTGSLLYCMPQVGTNVVVYMPEHNEGEAIALGCVRKNGEDCEKTANPDVRYLGTEHGSEMQLAPAAMQFDDGAGNTFAMQDGAGLVSNSPLITNIEADGEVILRAKGKVTIKASTDLHMESKQNESYFDLDEEMNSDALTGIKVQLLGASSGEPLSPLAEMSAVQEKVKKREEDIDWAKLLETKTDEELAEYLEDLFGEDAFDFIDSGFSPKKLEELAKLCAELPSVMIDAAYSTYSEKMGIYINQGEEDITAALQRAIENYPEEYQQSLFRSARQAARDFEQQTRAILQNVKTQNQINAEIAARYTKAKEMKRQINLAISSLVPGKRAVYLSFDAETRKLIDELVDSNGGSGSISASFYPREEITDKWLDKKVEEYSTKPQRVYDSTKVLSKAIDFIPVLRSIKGIFDLIKGKDILTGAFITDRNALKKIINLIIDMIFVFKFVKAKVDARPKPPAEGFKGGGEGEEFLKEVYGGRSQVPVKTAYTYRHIDQLADGVAHESKVGYKTLTADIKKQIMKDVDMYNAGMVDEVKWHFFRSAITGKSGASTELLDFLTSNGISYKIY